MHNGSLVLKKTSHFRIYDLYILRQIIPPYNGEDLCLLTVCLSWVKNVTWKLKLTYSELFFSTGSGKHASSFLKFPRLPNGRGSLLVIIITTSGF